jgi:hypothetical protein
MTLVVAFTSSVALHFVSDTRRSPDETEQKRPADPLSDGILKCIAISSRTCVAFVGDVRSAQEAIDPLLRNPKGSRQEMRLHLLDCHRRARSRFGNPNVEFLLAESDAAGGNRSRLA